MQLEEALQTGAPPPPAPPAVAHTSNGGHISTTETVSSAPLSTGSGTSVELVGALFESIAALGTTDSRRRIKSATGDDDEAAMDVDDDDNDEDSISDDDAPSSLLLSYEPLPPAEGEEDVELDAAAAKNAQQHLDDLMHITDSVAQRASTLQGWIWSLLQRLEKGGDSSNDTSSNTLAQQVHAAQQQVARLKAKNQTRKAQMKELARTREEAQESEKRVRRGLYRLAAGRVQLKEVLKAIVATDEDKVLAAEWMGPSAVAASSGGATKTSSGTAAGAGTDATASSNSVKTEVKNGNGQESSTVSSAEVAQLQKKVSDLEQVASSRDEQIKSV